MIRKINAISISCDKIITNINSKILQESKIHCLLMNDTTLSLIKEDASFGLLYQGGKLSAAYEFRGYPVGILNTLALGEIEIITEG